MNKNTTALGMVTEHWPAEGEGREERSLLPGTWLPTFFPAQGWFPSSAGTVIQKTLHSRQESSTIKSEIKPEPCDSQMRKLSEAQTGSQTC